MSYYVVKVYGLVCDFCEASEETVPLLSEPNKLAWARRDLAKPPANWTYRGGKDRCAKCSAELTKHSHSSGEDSGDR